MARVEIRFVWDPAYRLAAGGPRAFIATPENPSEFIELPSPLFPSAEWDAQHWLFRMAEVPAGVTVRLEWDYA